MTTRRFLPSLAILSCLSWHAMTSHAITIVSPAEYNDMDAPGFASPWPDEGFRAVQIDDSSVFESLPEGGALLTEIALRPDQSVRVGSEIYLYNFILRLSVTSVDPLEMSDTFDENYGPEVFVVYEGPWSAIVQSPAGRVREFDYRFPLQEPFFYNPADGNLLIDWNLHGPRGSLPGNTTQHDLTNGFVAETRTTWSGSYGIASPLGSSGRFSSIVQFRFAMPGDFNDDTFITVEDIDLLTDAIARGVSHHPFDLNHDGIVDSSDRDAWVRDVKRTWYGDSNLDGAFNSSDLVHVFQSGHYEDGIAINSGWAEGDWNGDGDFDTGDMVLAFQDGGFEQGPRRTMAQVPEPSAAVLVLGGLLGAARAHGRVHPTRKKGRLGLVNQGRG